MADMWVRLSEGLKQVGAHWTAIAAVGTFALYLFGYLSLRYKLTVLGVGTDLHFLDERYLFEGVRFLVYVVSIVPNLLLVTLLIVAPAYLLSCAAPSSWRRRAREGIGGPARRAAAWWRQPPRLTIAGIILAVLVVQLFMRKVFPVSNLLLRGELPDQVGWPVNCILANGTPSPWIYFHGLVAATAVTSLCLLGGGALAAQDALSRASGILLAFLLAVQVLLLPINYGVLVSAGQAVPAVRSVDGGAPLAGGAAAWLVWEGRDGLTYLIKGEGDDPGQRMLVNLPKAKVEKIEIVRYDNNLLHRFFSASSRCLPHNPEPKGNEC